LHYSDTGRCRWCHKPINSFLGHRYCGFACLAADWLHAAVNNHPRLANIALHVHRMRHLRPETPPEELGRMARMLMRAGWDLEQVRLALKFTFGAALSERQLRGKLH
jgi:hypothetical protein